ncbi:MAG TPA: hypothetical protein VI522_06860 [Gammaproteobacteria bacterium]|nr:hypothetical protein [Gammaproteobacteria bacterium]
MDSKEKRLVVILLSISFTMLLAGWLFVPFVIHIWTYLANLAGEKDVFLAVVLLIYFVMFAFFGTALGILINTYGGAAVTTVRNGVRRLFNRK